MVNKKPPDLIGMNSHSNENQEVYYNTVLLFMDRSSNEQFNLRFFSS